MKKIQWEDLIETELAIPPFQDKKWEIKIFELPISIVKWNKDHYNGKYEIYAYDEPKLFIDIYHFKTKEEVIKFLNEIKEKK